MDVFDVVKKCASLGVKSIGFADHLNSLDKLELHASIRKDIESLDTDIEVYFGVELNYDGLDGEFVYSEQIRDDYGFQFAIGGIHSTYLDSYDLKKMVDIQHRHHLKTCSNQLVDVLVHPYWFPRGEFRENDWAWFECMPPVPESYTRELAQTAKETDTAIEINTSAILTSPAYCEQYVKDYVQYLEIFAEEGVCFSFGSDAHDIEWLGSVKKAWDVAERFKLTADRIWQPNCKAMKGNHE